MLSVMGKQGLVAIPGLGGDRRLFAPSMAHLPTLRVLNWLKPGQGWTLSDYARALIDRNDINSSQAILGVSLGGMLALEIARHTRVRGVVLFGSARNPKQIRAPLPLAAQVPVLPTLFYRCARALPNAAMYFGSTRKHADQCLIKNMATRCSPTLTHWAIKAIANWPGVSENPCAIWEVHGSRDNLIPPRPQSANAIIRGGGHLCILTHPRESAAAMRPTLRQWGIT